MRKTSLGTKRNFTIPDWDGGNASKNWENSAKSGKVGSYAFTQETMQKTNINYYTLFLF